MSNFNAFSLLLTENCNMGCKYCYEVNSKEGHKKNNMTKETALDIVNFMFEEAKDEKEISITLFGGEPTLMPDIIDLICTEGKKLSKKYNKPFFVGIITNATLMNEKLYNIIKKHLDIWGGCQLSIDGPYDIQDNYRVFKNGKGTFSTIEKSIDYWKSLFGKGLNAHGVLNKYSIGRLYESFIFFRENWDVERLWFIPAKDPQFTKEDVLLYDRELEKIYNYVMNKVRVNKNTDEVSFYAPLDRALRNGSAGKPCGAGESYCTITSNGEIWPCHHFYFIDDKKELKLGDIYNGVNRDKKRIWDEYDSSDLIGCKDCEHPACYRCIAENYEAYGSPFTQIKGLHCDLMKVDLKYQKLIKKELIDMGLLNKNVESNDGCLGNVNDCVGKQGDCPVVTSVDECIFDRKQSNTVKDFSDVKPEIKYDTTIDDNGGVDEQINVSCGNSSTCCGNCKPSSNIDDDKLVISKKDFKKLLDSVIEIYNNI